MQYTNVFRPYWISSAACRFRFYESTGNRTQDTCYEVLRPSHISLHWLGKMLTNLPYSQHKTIKNSQSTQLHGGRQLHLKPSAGDLHWTTPISWHRELLKNDKVG